MAIGNVNEVMHRIRVKLYPNYLHNVEGAYIARTDNEASLSIEEVCAALKNRGGFTGNYDDLVEHVKQYIDEAAYQLCDGFAVNTGYFAVHPNVGGSFNSANEAHDREKHPVTFRFRTLSALRALASRITVEIDGIADSAGYIDEFTDVQSGAINESLTPGGQFVIAGHKIKIAGEEADQVGVYFILASNPIYGEKASVHYAENSASRVIGIVPNIAAGQWKLEIRTQYSGSTALLQNIRKIAASFTLTVGAPQSDPKQAPQPGTE